MTNSINTRGPEAANDNTFVYKHPFIMRFVVTLRAIFLVCSIWGMGGSQRISWNVYSFRLYDRDISMFAFPNSTFYS